MSEPNLDAPGKPMMMLIDGRPHAHEQTKFDNCGDLMELVGDRDPTSDELARWALTRQEYEAFLMVLLDERDDELDRWAAIEARHEQLTGKKLNLPAVVKDRLGLIHLKEQPEQPGAPNELDEAD